MPCGGTEAVPIRRHTSGPMAFFADFFTIFAAYGPGWEPDLSGGITNDTEND